MKPSAAASHKVVRRTLADGTVREYRYPRHAPARPRHAAESMAALVIAYRNSPEWAALKNSTRRNYNYYLRHLEDYAAVPVREMKRRDLLQARDDIAAASGRGAANVFLRVSATLFNWARDREWIEHSPIDRAKALPGGHLAAWSAAEADQAMAVLPEPLRRVVVLARYTGQRRGDLIAMTWHDIEGARIRVRQQKTGAQLLLRLHPALARELAAWRRTATSTHVLTSEQGRPWTANHLTHTMAAELQEHGLRAGLNIHGLRKLAAAELADAGCSVHEIAAVTGHRSLAMVQLYTASANQARLADAAIVRLGNAAEKKRKTSRK